MYANSSTRYTERCKGRMIGTKPLAKRILISSCRSMCPVQKGRWKLSHRFRVLFIERGYSSDLDLSHVRDIVAAIAARSTWGVWEKIRVALVAEFILFTSFSHLLLSVF